MVEYIRRREMLGSDDGMNPWGKLILQVGVPSAIALYLVYLLGGSIVGELRAQTDTMKIQQIELAKHIDATAAMALAIREQRDSTDVMTEVLKQMCVHEAHNPGERTACFNASLRSNLILRGAPQ